jgi:peptidoglycan/LPS O-acetylase OafA/YrhL
VRNRYLDLLRAAAILRVIVYHLFGWPWLSILLPAMGVMFALAGSLTAASLDRRPAGAVLTSRLRRLLPPLWLLAAIAVPAMLVLGWAGQEGGDEPLSWKLGLWLLPIGDPPGSARGIDVWEPLWYIRAYLWFVLLSPLLYRAYRKIGWGAVAAPVVLLAVLDTTGFALPFGRADAAMWDFATYGACWIAGFARHDGRLARIRPGLVVAAAAVLGLAALYWLRGHAGETGWDLNEVPESQALWSLAFVLLVLRWQPDMSWLRRTPRLDGAVQLLNARAVTVYLWHNIAIAAVWPVLAVLALDDLGPVEGPVVLVASLLLTGVAVLAFGWVEDVAARRRPRLWPVGDGRGGADAEPAAPVGGSGAHAARSGAPTAGTSGLGAGSGAPTAGTSGLGAGSGAPTAGTSGLGTGAGTPAGGINTLSAATDGLRTGTDGLGTGGGGLGAGSGAPAAGTGGPGTGTGTAAGETNTLSAGSGGLGAGSRAPAAGTRGLGTGTGTPAGETNTPAAGTGGLRTGTGVGSRPTSDLTLIGPPGETDPQQPAGPAAPLRPASDKPWTGGRVAPVVIGDSGLPARRRTPVAPFPEAEVSFGLPDDRAGFGKRPETADQTRPAPAPDPDPRAAAGTWWGREHDQPK